MVHTIDDRSKALADLGAEIVTGDLQEIDTIKQAMGGLCVAPFAAGVVPSACRVLRRPPGRLRVLVRGVPFRRRIAGGRKGGIDPAKWDGN
jgi:hypothetical protein